MITMLSLRNKPSSTAAAKRRRRAAMSPIISPLSPTALLLLRGGGVVSADNNPTKAGLVPSPAAVSAYVETEMIESPTVTSSAIVSPTAQHRQLVALKYVGNNFEWGSFKLGECEGDCDEDKDCQDGFKCFQREPNQAVEGCQGGDNDSSKTDYCVAKKTPSPTLPPAPTISPKPTSEPTSSPTRMPTTASLPYKIRLYWDPSYFWQETRKETFWCWHCPGGCYEGNKIQIDYCDQSDLFQFYPIGTKNGYPYGTYRPKSNPNLCLAENGFNNEFNPVRLRKCNASDIKQKWVNNPAFYTNRTKFEIQSYRDTTKCLTQRHHPKADENVYPQSCSQARNDETSYWQCETRWGQ